MLETGHPFPPFTLPDQNGQEHSLKDYDGKWLVIYFYPKDNTSACTLEAQDFTAHTADFNKLGAQVIGVSPDSVKSHAGFTAKKELGLTLLSDPEHTLLEAAGVWRKKKMYGREYMGVVRTTALIDPKGLVREVWSNVKVPGHVEAVLKTINELKG
ncbi:peroxiredoxin [Deltaproteobacteria bacterium Smac51]|nr:peroxiredoxin [Deltaproteobacteria bacterium Smac51]